MVILARRVSLTLRLRSMPVGVTVECICKTTPGLGVPLAQRKSGLIRGVPRANQTPLSSREKEFVLVLGDSVVPEDRRHADCVWRVRPACKDVQMLSRYR